MLKIQSLLRKNRLLVLVMVILGILTDILLPNTANDLVIFTMALFWIIVVWLYQIRETILIQGSLMLIAICPFLLIIKSIYVAEKVAIWAFVFLAIGVLKKSVDETRQAWRRK